MAGEDDSGAAEERNGAGAVRNDAVRDRGGRDGIRGRGGRDQVRRDGSLDRAVRGRLGGNSGWDGRGRDHRGGSPVRDRLRSGRG